MLSACERFRIDPFDGWDALDAGRQRLLLAYDWLCRKEEAARDLAAISAGGGGLR